MVDLLGAVRNALDLTGVPWNPRGRGIAIRTGSLFLAASALLWVCRNGQSPVLVWIAFGLYISAAAIWVRGQYAASLTTGLWTPRWWFALALTLVCGVLFALALWKNVGWLFIGALVAGYFCLGYLSMALRRPPDNPTFGYYLRWLIALIALGALVLVGFALLGNDTPLRFLVALALLVPLTLGVLTTAAVGIMKDPGRPGATGFELWLRTHALRSGLVAGVGLLTIGVGIAVHRVPGRWMWIVAVVLTILVFALVSSTYADIAIIIAVIAILGITQPQQSRGDVNLSDANTQVLVAMGDSYMSGEGAKVFYDGTDDGDPENHCRQAPTAWSVLAAARSDFDGLYTVTCSGARTFNVNITKPDPPHGAKSPRSQFPDAIGQQLGDYKDDQRHSRFQPKLVVVGLGGNDAGFSTIGAMCLAPGNCKEEGEKLWIPKLADVEYQLHATFAQISETFPNTPVAVVGYPDPIYERDPNNPDDPPADCSSVPLSSDDRDFVEELLSGLNGAVSRAATDAGFYYVDDMANALKQANLQLCDPRNDNHPGLNIIGLQSVSGVAEDRFNPKNWYHNSLHPNEAGHAAMLTAFESWLKRKAPHPRKWDEELPADIPDHPRGQAMLLGEAAYQAALKDPVNASAFSCQLYDAGGSEKTCEDVGYLWIGSQIRNSLLLDWWGPIYLVMGTGAWLLAVTFFAWRMRVAETAPPPAAPAGAPPAA